MDSILEIKQETAEMIAAQARAHGLPVDDYLRALLQSRTAEAGELPLCARATPAELAQAYVEWAASHDPKTAVVLDDRRESIYEDEVH